ncbi:DUF2637 domain-containing protein [Lentzea aerocolonigenes]|uniref:DUF2637 domain-containing protein n=1 Tax=Lentzea aerocolonigenes TaxID=68170 RepID=UPI0004C2FB4D|nr:DUF2637 domain-containing protein [Lentzea aerocolonigenes]MCP2242723.1 Protein of unknown function (DUF2637) [Lentzea aerocolonigenes]
MTLVDRKAVRIAASTEADIRRADAAATRELEVARAEIELARERAQDERAARLARHEDRQAERARKRLERQERKADRRELAEQRRVVRAAWSARVTGWLADRVIVVPIVLAMVGAWWGQFQLFSQRLGWPALLAAAAATGIECIGFVCGRLAHVARQAVVVATVDGRQVERDDSAWVERLVMWLVVGYAAGSNWAHSGDPTVGVLSIVGVAVWETRERRAHRQALAAAGRLPARRPRFGLVRWLRYPMWTWRAWSVALRHGLTDATEALAVADREAAEHRARKAADKALGWRARRRFGRVVAARIKATDEERRRVAEAVIREAEQVTGAAALLFGPDVLRQRATGPRPTSDKALGDRDDERPGRSRWLGWLRVAGHGDRVAAETTDTEPVVIDGVDITDLMPAARQAATELGDRLSRDALCDALRAAGLTVGGKRRKAVYDAVLAERDRAA